ncbi:unnamed protein product [Zymoseptoria tritici ST99CH_1A5]|uniref:Uncharacterized protein n=2 Tax=Zymoseptoria tritici TaxID=1047171 RepID=A0A2H1GU13_ZYMTR|nr:unnamed protein product [Zymoseptoria tritici ST99CH_1E4]SMR59919.1 unnamed protein product [Zymoseptoria tritici ST99CH_3D1]SMY27107.1 unnamed protein product [Zymoseptoria tritici ST99CH_1A5]
MKDNSSLGTLSSDTIFVVFNHLKYSPHTARPGTITKAFDMDCMYQDDYNKALQWFKDGEYPEAIRIATHTLTDLMLPPFWQIKTCLLIVSAEDDWDQAERIRLAAEDVWSQAIELYPESDKPAHTLLAELRVCLDQLAKNQQEDLSATEAEMGEEEDDQNVDESDELDGEEAYDYDEHGEYHARISRFDRTQGFDVVKVLYETIRRRKTILDQRQENVVAQVGLGFSVQSVDAALTSQ